MYDFFEISDFKFDNNSDVKICCNKINICIVSIFLGKISSAIRIVLLRNYKHLSCLVSSVSGENTLSSDGSSVFCAFYGKS